MPLSIHTQLLAGTLALAALTSPAVNGAPSKRSAAKPAAPKKAASAKPTVVQQAKGVGVTIRLRRARWASSEEVMAWRGRGKALTLWLDAQLDALSVPNSRALLPEGAVPSDFIVNVRLLDGRGQAVQVLPVDPLKLWHRPSLPYVPAKSGFSVPGQSVWRAMPFDPDFEAVKLQVEWLKPGHPFDRKSLPASILGLEAGAIAPEARPWLQQIEMELPSQKIEPGVMSKAAPIAKAGDERLAAALYTWKKGGSTITSGEGAGQTQTYFEAVIFLRAKGPSDTSIPKGFDVTLRGLSGEPIKMTEMMGEASRWFAPFGKPLKAGERVLSGTFTVPAALATAPAETTWTLELQPRGGGSALTMRGLPTPPGFVGGAR